jgi:hypothetical protein
MDRVQPGGLDIRQPRSSELALDRRALLVSIPLVFSTVFTRGGRAQGSDAPSLSDAVGVLAKEQSAAEQYAVILATVGRKNVDAYVRGIQLYADAKSDFDALISQMRFDLVEGRDPSKSPKFSAAIEAAAKSHITFTNFVRDEIVGKTEGAKPGLIEVKVEVPDLVPRHRGFDSLILV